MQLQLSFVAENEFYRSLSPGKCFCLQKHDLYEVVDMLGSAADVLPGDPGRDFLPRRGLHPLLAGVPRPALLPRPHPPRVEPQVSQGGHTEDK